MSWSDREFVDVERTNGGLRSGIVIGRVNDTDLAGRIWNFVCNVREFKDAVNRGGLDNEAVRQKIAEWDEFREEASGRRKGRRRAEIDYVSYHGDVVKALRDYREGKACKVDLESTHMSALRIIPLEELMEYSISDEQ